MPVPQGGEEDHYVLNRRRDSVLVVDPDPIGRRRAERLLAREGCVGVGVGNVRDALAAIAEATPDLVLLARTSTATTG